MRLTVYAKRSLLSGSRACVSHVQSAISATGVAGVLAHRRLGHVKLAAAAPLGLGTCVGAFAGGRLASGLDEEPMRLGFGALMVALGAKTLLKKP